MRREGERGESERARERKMTLKATLQPRRREEGEAGALTHPAQEVGL